MKKTLTNNVKYVILIIALAMCVFGIFSGEMEVVLAKAAKLCLECCGIG